MDIYTRIPFISTVTNMWNTQSQVFQFYWGNWKNGWKNDFFLYFLAHFRYFIDSVRHLNNCPICLYSTIRAKTEWTGTCVRTCVNRDVTPSRGLKVWCNTTAVAIYPHNTTSSKLVTDILTFGMDWSMF